MQVTRWRVQLTALLVPHRCCVLDPRFINQAAGVMYTSGRIRRPMIPIFLIRGLPELLSSQEDLNIRYSFEHSVRWGRDFAMRPKSKAEPSLLDLTW